MQKTDQELFDIADKMLADLEKQYWQVQNQNINFDVLCPQNHQEEHQDYQPLDDNDEIEQSNSQSDEEPNEDGLNDNQQENNMVNLPQNINNNVNNVEGQVKVEISNDSKYQLGELMEVMPTQQWVAVEKQVDIDCEKVKQLTLKMNIQAPNWAQDEHLFKQRIIQLFGCKK